MLRNTKILVTTAMVLFVAVGIGLYEYMASRESSLEIIYLEQPLLPEVNLQDIVAAADSGPAETRSATIELGLGTEGPKASDIWKSDFDREAEIQDREILQEAVNRGYSEVVDGGFSDYKTYDAATLIAMADANDPMAQVYAVINHSIPFEKRLDYALEAAAAGYTSGLVRMIGSGELTHSTFLNGEDVSLSAMKYGFLVAAARLGDPVAERWVNADEATLYNFTGKLTDSDRALGDEVARKIVDIIKELK